MFSYYVDGSVHKRLEQLTTRKGKAVTDMMNQIFKKNLEWWRACGSFFARRRFMARQPAIP